MRATSKLIISRWFLTLLIGGGGAFVAFGQGTLSGTATLNSAQNGSLYDYTITLNNTGTDPIGTFWYAWIPGQFYLPTSPASTTAPSGWTASVVGNYSIEYTAGSGSSLGAGSSLDFGFSSTDTPATLAGDFQLSRNADWDFLSLRNHRLYNSCLPVCRAIGARTFCGGFVDRRLSRLGGNLAVETAKAPQSQRLSSGSESKPLEPADGNV